MKIATITMQWPAASETFAARDMLTLQGMGHDVTVYAMRPDTRDVDQLMADMGVRDIACLRMGFGEQWRGIGAMVRHFPKFFALMGALIKHERNVKLFFKSILLMPATFRIFDAVKRTTPDIVHLFWGHYPSLIGWLVARYLPEIKLTQFLGPYDLQYNYALSSVVAQDAKAVFTHTAGNRPALNDLGIDDVKIMIVHRGINTDHEVTCEKDQNAIIFVGRLMRAKGIFEMLDVMRMVINKNPDATLTVIGDGPDRTEFEQMVSRHNLTKHVVMKGWLAPDDVAAEVAKATAMLFLSHSERLPNAVKEAMLQRTIPVSSNTIGIDEMIENGVNGYIVDDINDAKGIADIVCGVLSDHDKRAVMVHSAYQTIKGRFDVKSAMGRYVDVWSAL